MVEKYVVTKPVEKKLYVDLLIDVHRRLKEQPDFYYTIQDYISSISDINLTRKKLLSEIEKEGQVFDGEEIKFNYYIKNSSWFSRLKNLNDKWSKLNDTWLIELQRHNRFVLDILDLVADGSIVNPAKNKSVIPDTGKEEKKEDVVVRLKFQKEEITKASRLIAEYVFLRDNFAPTGKLLDLKKQIVAESKNSLELVKKVFKQKTGEILV